MKKFIFVLFLIISFIIIPHQVKCESNNVVLTDKTTYEHLFLTMIHEKIDNAIKDYYDDILTTTPREDPLSVKIINIKRPKTLEFIVKFEVMPYIGPHNSIGIDHITFKIELGKEPELIKYEHIKSYPTIEEYLIKDNI